MACKKQIVCEENVVIFTIKEGASKIRLQRLTRLSRSKVREKKLLLGFKNVTIGI
jgi:hypothetical protein